MVGKIIRTLYKFNLDIMAKYQVSMIRKAKDKFVDVLHSAVNQYDTSQLPSVGLYLDYKEYFIIEARQIINGQSCFEKVLFHPSQLKKMKQTFNQAVQWVDKFDDLFVENEDHALIVNKKYETLYVKMEGINSFFIIYPCVIFNQNNGIYLKGYMMSLNNTFLGGGFTYDVLDNFCDIMQTFNPIHFGQMLYNAGLIYNNTSSSQSTLLARFSEKRDKK